MGNKFRLAVFNTQPPQCYRGGVERRISETTCRLSDQVDITVYSGTKACFKTSTVINGVNIVPLYSTDKKYPLDNWSFNRTVAKTVFDADIYEAHNDSGYGLFKALKKQIIKKPFIHIIHGVLAEEFEQAKLTGHTSFRGRAANYFMTYLSRLEKKTAKEADLIVTISTYSFEKIQKHYDIAPEKIRIVSNGVDTERYKPIETEKQVILKRQFGLKETPVVLFVGNLIPRKGLTYLIEAAKQVVKTYPYTQFVIVGDGPLRGRLIDSLIDANLLGNFMFMSGLTDDELSAMYGCSDVFVLPSIQEGQGIVLLEALASGKPVVAFDIGGVNEVVINGETGLLASNRNSDELATALLRFLSNSELQQKMGLAGRRLVEGNFTWDICTQKMFRVYREMLNLE
ncbi:MAG: glycosyltransferase family 4 protein [Nitrososphaerota archaeon]|jgi:glycosyltransferase involved in cell wall biosynthesis|nr:glycosyltransferase family 4 protein [Nitrososphaerota archaeon]